MSDITVILTAHNEGAWLKAALESVAESIHRIEGIVAVETIVVLDKADDATESVAKNYQSSAGAKHKITVESVKFGSLGKSRNHGVSVANGQYISFLDADDLFGHTWLESCISLRPTEKQILHPEINYFFGTGRLPLARGVWKHLSPDDDAFQYAAFLNGNHYSSLIFAHKKILGDFKYHPDQPDKQIGFEDWDFNLRTITSGLEHVIVPRTIHFLRQKSSSMKQQSANGNFKPHFRSFRNLRMLHFPTPDRPNW